MRFRVFYCLLLLLPAGCNTLPGLDFLQGGKAHEATVVPVTGAQDSGDPKYRVGDRYTFDNPVVRWQVVAIEGERVRWLSDAGDRQVTGFNPLLPALEWNNQKSGSGRRFIRDVEGSLFPMKVGATLRFRSTVTTSSPPFGWEHAWSCSVTGQEDVEVLGNVFDTFVVACGREEPGEVVFYYAPKVGHYVVQRIGATGGSRGRTRNLLSFERSDGTSIAGVVKAPAKLPFPPKEEPVVATAAPTPVPARSPKTSPPVPVKMTPAKSTQTLDVNSAMDSVLLKEPRFGGNRAPPQIPVKPSVVATASKKAGVGVTAAPRVVPPRPKPRAIRPPSVPAPRKFQTARITPPVPPPPKPVSTEKGPVRAAPISAPSPVPSPPKALTLASPTGSGLPPVPVARPKAKAPVAEVIQKPVPVPVPQIANRPPPPPPPPPPLPERAASDLSDSSGKQVADEAAEEATPPTPPAAPRQIASAAPQQGVHLASYRDLSNARRGWEQLARRNSDLLGALRADIRRIEVPEKGIFYRLYAAPVGVADAGALCGKLRNRGVYCEPQG